MLQYMERHGIRLKRVLRSDKAETKQSTLYILNEEFLGLSDFFIIPHDDFPFGEEGEKKEEEWRWCIPFH